MGLQTFGRLVAVNHQNNDSLNPGPSAIKSNSHHFKAASGQAPVLQRLGKRPAGGFIGPPTDLPSHSTQTPRQKKPSGPCFGPTQFLLDLELRTLRLSESLCPNGLLSQEPAAATTPAGSRDLALHSPPLFFGMTSPYITYCPLPSCPLALTSFIPLAFTSRCLKSSLSLPTSLPAG